MPFIFDNFDWKLVDDKESYDKGKFGVVRTLRIEPSKHHEEFMVSVSNDLITIICV